MEKRAWNTTLRKIVALLAMATFAFSCVEESARKGRPVIKNNQGATTTKAICTQIYNPVDFSCTSNRNNACPTGTHTASATEKSDVIEEINNLSELTQEEADEIITIKDGLIVEKRKGKGYELA